MFSWPDIKLSLRLLIRNPGLTMIATVGITVGIAIAAGMFGFLHANFAPTLPLDEGDRIIALENWDIAKNNEDRQSLHDFVAWRDQMTFVVEISAFRYTSTTMQAGDRLPETVRIAAMSSSGFRVARVPALLGRFLTPDDDRDGAPPVVVIGYSVWQSRFGQDRSVIGQQVRFGTTQFTIVGVMPEGFAFPVNHQYWIVDRSFAQRFLDGTSAVGRRIRYAASAPTGQPSPWYGIVGVAENYRRNPIDPDVVNPTVLYPVAPEQLAGAGLTVRLRGSAASRMDQGFARRVHQILAAVDPALRMGEVRASADTGGQAALAIRLVALGHRRRGAGRTTCDRDAGDRPDHGAGGRCRRARTGATQPADSADGSAARRVRAGVKTSVSVSKRALTRLRLGVRPLRVRFLIAVRSRGTKRLGFRSRRRRHCHEAVACCRESRLIVG